MTFEEFDKAFIEDGRRIKCETRDQLDSMITMLTEAGFVHHEDSVAWFKAHPHDCSFLSLGIYNASGQFVGWDEGGSDPITFDDAINALSGSDDDWALDEFDNMLSGVLFQAEGKDG